MVDRDFYSPYMRDYLDYDERTYECPKCQLTGSVFQVQKKTPVALSVRTPWLFEVLIRHLRAR